MTTPDSYNRMRGALNALMLEAPEAVVRDVQTIVYAYVDEQAAIIAELRQIAESRDARVAELEAEMSTMHRSVVHTCCSVDSMLKLLHPAVWDDIHARVTAWEREHGL